MQQSHEVLRKRSTPIQQKTMNESRTEEEKKKLESLQKAKDFLVKWETCVLIDRLKSSSQQVTPLHPLLLKGATASLPSMLLAWLSAKEHILFVAEDEEAAGYLHSDLACFIARDQLAFFPSAFRRGIKYGHSDEAGEVMRTELVAALTHGDTPFIVTYPEALMEKLPEENALSESLFTISKGSTINLVDFREFLLQNNFAEVDYVYNPGEFAFRGSIIDLFSFNSERPYRLDLFDDLVESLRTFDIASQLSLREEERVTIAPNMSKSEGKGSTLLSLLPESYLVGVSDWDMCQSIFQKLNEEEAVVVEGEGFTDTAAMKKLLVDPQRLTQEIEDRRLIYLHESSKLPSTSEVAFQVSPQPQFHKNYQLLIDSLQKLQGEGLKCYFLSESPQQVERLGDILSAHKAISYLPTSLPFTLHEGFECADLGFALYTDHELFERFHKYRLSGRRIKNSAAAITLKELRSFSPGDYLVHYDHGIGQFAGLFHTEIGGVKQEVVKMTYQGGDYIYVSLHSLHKLSKYRAKDDEAPQLSQLGSGAWERLKERTKKKVKDIARDLIKLYADRKESSGFSFSPDSYLQHELEASFMYEETPDQLLAMEAVKRDMESPKPMDRLICGDVGFGKTEVAIRAAFKAVADSKQVAVLVPTTLLAFQHYTTFCERLKDFPVKIEYLSRAQRNKKSKEILEDLKTGKVDIVIGTHRLVSSDVTFKNLGLLIIDEEQKFGVTVKEKLRKLQVNVDTLTMSATPIPRTLQFSLMGTRDLSNIMTPPRNRQPIQTELIRFNDDVIREAINYELSRQGQVYFVHNRIQDIEEVADRLHRIVPDTRIAVGHGQMEPGELEKLIVAFAQREYDILLSTTIIENGIDHPNANTIFIDEAYRYGLSDLHQLRGRVGRSNRKAFCFLITPPMEVLSDVSRRRLRTLEAYSELGSGMRIALQDLDIRGAGNVFGREQSGFIADLGFDTYHRVFDEAVKEVKREEFGELFAKEADHLKEDIDTLFESDLLLAFPSSYIPGDGERIELYRELDGIKEKEELEGFRKRLIDRFGPIPKEGEGLIAVPELRALGSAMRIPRISIYRGEMRLFLPKDDKDPFYKSDDFGRLLSYVAVHSRESHIEESKTTQRIIRFEKVDSVENGIALLNRVSLWPISL